jgi:hypothetical protein
MTYLGSLISSYTSHQLQNSNELKSNSSEGEVVDFRTFYDTVSSPLLQSLLETGYLNSSHLIQAMQTQLSQSPSPLNPTHQRIQFKYQRLSQFLISSPATLTAPSRNSREFSAGDWTHADFFLFLPVVILRFYKTPQLFPTLQLLLNTLSSSSQNPLTAGCLILGRLLQRCLLKRCLPSLAMRSLLLPDEHLSLSLPVSLPLPLPVSNTSTSTCHPSSNDTPLPLSSLEKQFLECSLSEYFYATLMEIQETLSAHPSYPSSSSSSSSSDPSPSSPPPPAPPSSQPQQEFFEIRSFLILELIQNSRGGSYSLEKYVQKLSTKQRELWEEAKLSRGSSSPQTKETKGVIATDDESIEETATEERDAKENQEQLYQTLSELSSSQPNWNLGTLLCLMFLLKTCQSFEEAVLLNLKIGGRDVDLRSPLCGAFFAASSYPLSSHENHWSSRAIPPKWIASFPEATLKRAISSINQALPPPSS